MLASVYAAIEAILDADETLYDADKEVILKVCKQPRKFIQQTKEPLPQLITIKDVTGMLKVNRAKAEAFRRANDYCISRGKVMVPVVTQNMPPSAWSWGGYELTFRALDQNDPEVHRPNPKPFPNVNVNIENK